LSEAEFVRNDTPDCESSSVQSATCSLVEWRNQRSEFFNGRKEPGVEKGQNQMGQVDYTSNYYLALGKNSLGSLWPSLGLTDSQIISIGQGVAASASTIPTTEPAVAAPQILFNAQPAPLSSGGIKIPNSSTVVKNPA
jgi:hypothetical protein